MFRLKKSEMETKYDPKKVEEGKILMQKRTYPKGKWGLPGGLMELGESTVETAVREVREETNLTVENLKLLGVYSGKDHLCKAENGDEWYVVVTAYTTKDYSGTLMINDGESEALEWFCPEEIPKNIPSTHRLVIDDYKAAVENNSFMTYQLA